jgi:hypothetical protein
MSPMTPGLPSPMFPDTLVFVPTSHQGGARAGDAAGQVPGPTIAGYVETTTFQVQRRERIGRGGEGSPVALTPVHLIFPDPVPGTGSPPAECATDDRFTWTAHRGKALANPRVFLANGPAVAQGPLWLVEAREEA